MLEQLLRDVAQWAEQREDVRAVVLVGSHARGMAGRGSDVDLVILTDDPEWYVANSEWQEQFGAVSRRQVEAWGRVTSVRVWYAEGLEVEFGFTTPAWAQLPLDPGTTRVLQGGFSVISDTGGLLTSLAAWARRRA